MEEQLMIFLYLVNYYIVNQRKWVEFALCVRLISARKTGDFRADISEAKCGQIYRVVVIVPVHGGGLRMRRPVGIYPVWFAKVPLAGGGGGGAPGG